MDHKIFAEVKEITPKGEVTAEVATLNVKDKDEDVTRPGFFGTQDVKMVLSHDWGTVMLGKGQVSDSDGKVARFEGKMNLDEADVEARAVFSRLKFDLDNPPPLIEWSYGFRLHKGGRVPFKNDEQFGDGYFLQPLGDGSPGAKVDEVSPVLVGAGEGTGTTSVKTMKEGGTISMLEALAELGDEDAQKLLAHHRTLDVLTEDQKFADQLDGTLAAVDRILKRAEEISALRPLGSSSREKLADVVGSLEQFIERGKVLTVDQDPDALQAWLEAQNVLNRVRMNA